MTQFLKSLFTGALLALGIAVTTPALASPIAMGDKGGWIGVTPQGTLVAWGNNDENGLYVPRSAANNYAYSTWLSTPTRILPDQSGFVEVASTGQSYQAGYDRNVVFFALQSNGTLWSWGHSMYSALGDPNRADPVVYTKNIWGTALLKEILSAPGIILTDVVHITTSGKSLMGGAVSSQFVMALKRDGTVWVWGRTIPTPTQVGSGFTSIHSQYGLKSDGSVWEFYDNYDMRQLKAAGTFGPNDRMVDGGSTWNVNIYTILRSDGTIYDSAYGTTTTLDNGVLGTVLIKGGKAYFGSVEVIPQTSRAFSNVAMPIMYAAGGACTILLKTDGSVTAMPIDGVTQDTTTGHCGVGPSAAISGEKTILTAGSIRSPYSYSVSATMTTYSATVGSAAGSSPTTGYSYTVSASASSSDVGKKGAYFVAVLTKDGSIFTMNSQRQWAPFASCNDAQSFQSGTLPASASSTLTDGALPQSSVDAILAGASFYAGYGLGSSVQAACTEMLNSGRIRLGCSVVKGYGSGYGYWGQCTAQ